MSSERGWSERGSSERGSSESVSSERAAVAGIVLAAGQGRRLRPLSSVVPKALCPMGASTLVDRAVVQVTAAFGSAAELNAPVAVNVHHGREAMLAHFSQRGDVHLAVEEPHALGTAGAVAGLAGWLDGRAALVVNADTVHDEDLHSFVDEWDGGRVRVLKVGESSFGPRSGVVASIVPRWAVQRLAPEPSGLWEVLWRPELDAGRVDEVTAVGTVIDCGTPADYLRANLWLSGGESVIGEGAVLRGSVERSVIWPGAVVAQGEHLVDAVRANAQTTVLVR